MLIFQLILNLVIYKKSKGKLSIHWKRPMNGNMNNKSVTNW